MKNELISKSKYSPVAIILFIVLIVIILFFSLLMFVGLFKSSEGIILVRKLGLALFFLIIIFLFVRLLSIVPVISIYDDGIVFKSFLSFRSRFYFFHELEGYIESKSQTDYDTIFFLQKNHKIEWICGIYYKNYYDLISSLALEPLGIEHSSEPKQAWDILVAPWFRVLNFKKDRKNQLHQPDE